MNHLPDIRNSTSVWNYPSAIRELLWLGMTNETTTFEKEPTLNDEINGQKSFITLKECKKWIVLRAISIKINK